MSDREEEDEDEESVSLVRHFDSEDVIVCRVCKRSNVDCVRCKQCCHPVCMSCKIVCSMCSKDTCYICSFSVQICTLCIWEFVV